MAFGIHGTRSNMDFFSPKSWEEEEKIRRNGTTENMSRDNAGVGVLWVLSTFQEGRKS